MVDYFFEVDDLVGPFDIIHAHDWLCANALIWIKKARPYPSVITIHSTEYGRCGNALVNGRSTRIRDQEKAGTYWADRVITVSRTTKDEITWMYEVPESKISVIHNGVNHKRFDIDIDPGGEKRKYNIGPLDPTVLFCGRLAWQKGADILVEAIPSIVRKYSNAKFIFAGDGDQRGSLENRVRQLGVAHAVRFLGYHNGDTLTKLFKLCDVVCVPSRNEPFGIVLLEAWSAAKPVVATEIGGPKEYVNHEYDGLKIFPRVDSVVWGIDRIFSDFERARWMGNNGQKEVLNHFSWDTISAQTIQVYQLLSPGLHTELDSQKSRITNILDRDLPLEIIGVPDKGNNHKKSVKLEAKLMIPARALNADTWATFESLKTRLTDYGFNAVQKDHYLKIKGDWQDITSALARTRNDFFTDLKKQDPPERTQEGRI